MKNKFLKIFCIFLTPILVFSCDRKKENISEYYYNNEEHYAYNQDKDEIIKGSHTFNHNHKCSVCGYEDPILIVNQDGVLTGLTEHGKTLEKITLTNKVYFIDDNAFNDSKVKNIHLTKSILGMGIKAYDYISSIEYETEGAVPELVKKDKGYYLPDLVSNEYECYANGKNYSTLSDALDNLEENNTTIFLLKEIANINRRYDLAFETRIANLPNYIEESHINTHNSTIHIDVSGVLEVGSNITLERMTRVDLDIRKVNSYYTSGAIAFEGLSTAPEVIVYYTGEFITDSILVKGACQTVNKAIFIPVDFYAYGTLEFNDTLDLVTGLSPFGKTCSRLTITAPAVYKNAKIQKEAFTQRYNKTIKIISKFVDFTVWIVEGVFNHVTIGEGITEVGEGAFNSYVETKLSDALTSFIAMIFCHISSVTIGSTCEYLAPNAFFHEHKLTTVNGDCSSLKEIQGGAFNGCKSLKSVNLLKATSLTKIDKSFNDCKLMSRFLLPYSNGWKFNDTSYLYEDLTAENVAKMFISMRYIVTRDATVESKMYGVYNSKQVDEYKVPNRVRYYDTFENAIKGINNDETLMLLNQENDLSSSTFTINKRISIDGSKMHDNKSTLKCNLTIEKNSYVKFSNRVDYTGNIILNNVDATSISQTGSVAFEYSGQTRNDTHANVRYQNYTDKSINVIKTGIDNSSFSSYGLFNFSTISSPETVSSLSELGKIMTTLKVDNIFTNDYDNITIDANVFANNKVINNLELSSTVKTISEGCFKNCAFSTLKMSYSIESIPKYAFQNCSNLTKLDLSDLYYLNRICEYAFQGCKFTEASVASFSGWKYNGVGVHSDIMSNSKKLATMLTTTHVSGIWTHSEF